MQSLISRVLDGTQAQPLLLFCVTLLEFKVASEFFSLTAPALSWSHCCSILYAKGIQSRRVLTGWKETMFTFTQVFSTSLWGGMLVPIGDKPSSIADRSVWQRLFHLSLGLWFYCCFGCFLPTTAILKLFLIFMWKQVLKYSVLIHHACLLFFPPGFLSV